jgi:hypothetical protein
MRFGVVRRRAEIDLRIFTGTLSVVIPESVGIHTVGARRS